jgi:Transposase
VLSHLDAGDPDGEIGAAYLAKELLHESCPAVDGYEARHRVLRVLRPLRRPELERLARTIACWEIPIRRWHRTELANAATNLVIKDIMRIGFGSRDFQRLSTPLLLRGAISVAESRHRINTTTPSAHQCGEPHLLEDCSVHAMVHPRGLTWGVHTAFLGIRDRRDCERLLTADRHRLGAPWP